LNRRLSPHLNHRQSLLRIPHLNRRLSPRQNHCQSRLRIPQPNHRLSQHLVLPLILLPDLRLIQPRSLHLSRRLLQVLDLPSCRQSNLLQPLRLRQWPFRLFASVSAQLLFLPQFRHFLPLLCRLLFRLTCRH
jgi:hypothetical protein